MLISGPSLFRFTLVTIQIDVPLDPACLYGTFPLPRQQHQSEMDTSPGASEVNEEDLGGFSQLSVVEGMLDRGEGLEAGLQGVAMTRWADSIVYLASWHKRYRASFWNFIRV